MKRLLRKIVEQLPCYYRLRNLVVIRRQERELWEWERSGRPAPPPHIVKQRTLRKFAREFGLQTLVETGTYYGDMVAAMKGDFDRIYSIELSDDLYRKAKRRFKREPGIELIQGDSGVELKALMGKIDQPTLFWLDGHYSAGVTARGDKDTPIYEELTHILADWERGHVIIIDDARCFGTDPAYPSMGELRDFVQSRRSDLAIAVGDDSVRITPTSGIPEPGGAGPAGDGNRG